MNDRLLLLTNDDGVHAEGLRALASVLASLGEVHIVAPDREMSACGHALTLKHPLRAQRIAERVYSVDGTPADCVNLAVLKLIGRRPDLVVSGINSGANLGHDVFYSGTVGGAREGTFFGIPSFAISLASRSDSDFRHAADIAARLSTLILDQGLPDGTLLNVNVPPCAPLGAVITVQGRREHGGNVLEGLDPRRRRYFWIEDERDRWLGDDPAGMADVHAIERGLVSVTPLQTDTTHHSVLARFRAWEVALSNDRPR